MTGSATETENNVKKRWFSEPNIAIFTLLLTTLGIMLGGFYHISSGIADANRLILEVNANLGRKIDETNERIDDTNERIDETNKRIDETNKRIDDTNTRIDDLQYLFANLNAKVGELENNDNIQEILINQNSEKFEQQSLETRELNDRLSSLELAQAGENQ